MKLKNKPTFIDLFAGCGGLSLGLEKAGFFPLYVNELNADALETYLQNRDEHFPHLRRAYNSRDIKSVIQDKRFFKKLFEDLSDQFNRDFANESVELVVGGPPCQGFSGIGIRRSYSVDKVQLPSNHLYQDMAFFVHNVRPKLFLFENVEGLLSARWTKEGRKGEIFEDVLRTFKSIPNYEVKFKLVHAKDYGVPQNRPRILLVGKRADVSGSFSPNEDAVAGGFLPEPIGGYPNIEEIFSDLIDPEFENGGQTTKYPSNPNNDWQLELRRLPNSENFKAIGDELTEHKYSKHTERVKEKFKHMIENNGAIPDHLKTKKFAQRVLPAKWGNSGPTITACSLPDDFVHFNQPRSLTVREWARLQTFPDWYDFAGKRTTGGIRRAGNPKEALFEREVPKYTQIGNAVPVKLAYEVGKHFRTMLGC